MKLKKSLICACALIGSLAVSAITPLATAAETVRLKVATQYAKDHPSTKALYEFKDRVEKESDGRINIRIFPANQLGDYTQVYEELRRGTIDMGLISVPSQFDTRLEMLYLHYLASDFNEARKIYARGSFLWNTANDLHNKLGVRFLGFNIEGTGGLGLIKKPENLKDPHADKDILLRVPQMDVFKTAADDEGFDTVAIPFAELYTALQTGVADGWSGGPPVVNYLQFGDVIKYFLVNNNFIESTSYLMSDKVWKKLSKEDQELIAKATTALSEQSFDIAEENDGKYLKLMADKGIEVIYLSEEQLKAWATLARQETWPKLEERLTPEIINGLKSQY